MSETRLYGPERAADEMLFRRLNERAERLNEAFDLVLPDAVWTCECYRLDCVEGVKTTLAQYDAVRAEPRRFLVAPSDEHVHPEIDRVVERNQGYWVVERVEPARASANGATAAIRPPSALRVG